MKMIYSRNLLLKPLLEPCKHLYICIQINLHLFQLYYVKIYNEKLMTIPLPNDLYQSVREVASQVDRCRNQIYLLSPLGYNHAPVLSTKCYCKILKRRFEIFIKFSIDSFILHVKHQNYMEIKEK